jgi:hypothetical protein
LVDEFPSRDVLDSSPVTLGDYYRENGESEHVLRLEAVLPVGWLPTREVSVAAGVTVGFAYKALPYLVEEGRAERRKARGRDRRPRWEWRRPPG